MQAKAPTKIKIAVKKPLPTVSKPTFQKRTALFYFCLGIVTLSFGILTYYASKDPYFPFDLKVTLALQSLHLIGFDGLMRFISLLGEALPGTLLLLFIGAAFFVKGHHLEAVMILISTFGAEVVSVIFKQLVHRVRPDPTLIHQVMHYTQHDSFPSGHVLYYIGLFGFLLFLTYTLFSKSPWHRLFLVLFAVLILLVGPSRIYLGAHWFSDVLGAYLIGFVWLVIMAGVYQKVRSKSAEQ